MRLLGHYSRLFSKKSEYKVIEQIIGKHIKLVDASIMNQCLKLFPWAKFPAPKGGIKMHVSQDKATMIPDMINLTSAKVSDRRGADNFRYPKDMVVVATRDYFDFVPPPLRSVRIFNSLQECLDQFTVHFDGITRNHLV